MSCIKKTHLVDTKPVCHGGDCAEGPTTAATALVADLLDAGALRPLAARVKLRGNILQVSQKVRLPQRRHMLLVHRVDAQQSLLAEREKILSF